MKRKDATPSKRRERFVPFPDAVFPAAAQHYMQRGRAKRLVCLQAEALGVQAPASPLSSEDREQLARVARAARRLAGSPR